MSDDKNNPKSGSTYEEFLQRANQVCLAFRPELFDTPEGQRFTRECRAAINAQDPRALADATVRFVSFVDPEVGREFAAIVERTTFPDHGALEKAAEHIRKEGLPPGQAESTLEGMIRGHGIARFEKGARQYGGTAKYLRAWVIAFLGKGDRVMTALTLPVAEWAEKHPELADAVLARVVADGVQS